MSVSIANSTLNTYAYYYKSQYQPSLDKNSDSRWDKSEVQSYADSYQKATGESLDVDKIMSTYAKDDGYVYFSDWTKVRDDDALGFSKLVKIASSTDSADTSTSSAAASSSGKVDLSAISDYTYVVNGKLQPNLDKNFDGYWNQSELEDYAAAYQKATGAKLDVESILSKYADESGRIGYAARNQIAADDALGFNKLNAEHTKNKEASPIKDASNEIKENWFSKTASKTTATTPADDAGSDLADLMASMSSTGKASFATFINKTDGMSALLNNFVASNSVGGMFGMYSAMSQHNNLGMYRTMSQYESYGSMSNQMMNMLV